MIGSDRTLEAISFGMKLRFLIVKFTYKCDAKCAICIEDSSIDKTELLPLNLIEKVFTEVKDMEIDMGLQGGEVLLFPEYCKEICDMWRSINKYGRTHMITNGFWGKDPKLIDYVENEIKPELIGISVDKWHQQWIPISSINNILSRLENNPNIWVHLFQIFSKNYPVVKNQSELGIKCNKKLFILGNALHYWGRGKKVIDEGDDAPNKREFKGERIQCDNFGLSLHPDGTIHSNCPAESAGCSFGKIENTNIKEIFEKLGRPFLEGYRGTTYSFTEICKGMFIDPLDPKWAINAQNIATYIRNKSEQEGNARNARNQ